MNAQERHQRITQWVQAWITTQLVEQKEVYLPPIGTLATHFHPEYILHGAPTGEEETSTDHLSRTLMPPRISLAFEPTEYLADRHNYTSLDFTAPDLYFPATLAHTIGELHNTAPEEVQATMVLEIKQLLTELQRGKRVRLLGMCDLYITEETHGLLLLNVQPTEELLNALNYVFGAYEPVALRPGVTFNDLETRSEASQETLLQIHLAEALPASREESSIVLPEKDATECTPTSTEYTTASTVSLTEATSTPSTQEPNDSTPTTDESLEESLQNAKLPTFVPLEEIPKSPEEDQGEEKAHSTTATTEVATKQNTTPTPKQDRWKKAQALLWIGTTILFIIALIYFYPRKEKTPSSVPTSVDTLQLAQHSTPATLTDSTTLPDTPDSLAIAPAQPKSPSLPLDTITIKQGDTLAKFARHYYGNTHYWVYIYIANHEQIPDPNNVEIGKELLIMPLTHFDLPREPKQAEAEARAWESIILSGRFDSYKKQKEEIRQQNNI